MLYFAYSILRGSFDDEQRRARISAVYNIFAFAVFVPLIFIVPRLTDFCKSSPNQDSGVDQVC
jgi:heme exporter protein C